MNSKSFQLIKIMTVKSKNTPECFARLDTVFPMGKDGLRKTPEDCMSCSFKTECLGNAMKGKGGIQAREELVDRAYESGMIGFFKRWSKKKYLKKETLKNK